MAKSAGEIKANTGSPLGALVPGLVGLFLGASIGSNLWGALSGAALGVAYAGWRSSRSELEEMRRSLATLERMQSDLDRRVGVDRSEVAPAVPTTEDDSPETGAERVEPPDAEAPESSRVEAENEDAPLTSAVEAAFAARSIGAPPQASSSPSPSPSPEPRPRVPSGPTPFERGANALRSFFFGGNTVVRAGLLVLLVGVTLLAKYAADNALFPVEARLASAALLGLALVAFGFRQRMDRPGFGMSLQGGGIAALYLVTFFAFRVYALVPAGLAFGLFVGLAIATVILSVLQDAEPLLIIGSLGGFLAPVLASTGEGNHVALFTYYLLLDFSIAVVAWRQAWRAPALIAFVCTYGIATAWGVLRYEPDVFASTEPFVLAFMALFTAIAVLHAWRRPPQLRGVIDGTLVFGTPFISIMLQSALVHERELGLALSSGGFGVFYAVVAVGVWRVAPRDVRPLAEAFVAIAVGFATMAIPFAFDEALTTSIAWALEGAGLYWVGVRQARAMPRFAGVALQGLAAAAFWTSAVIEGFDSSGFMPIANGRALSCLSLALAGLFIAQQAYSRRVALRPEEVRFAQGLGVWGLLWWSGGVLAEIDQFVSLDYEPAAILLSVAVTVIAVELIAFRSDWEVGRLLALGGLPAAALTFVMMLEVSPHLLADAGWLGWAMVFFSFYFVWERLNSSESSWVGAFRTGALWLFALFAAFASRGFVGVALGLANDWQTAAFSTALAGALLGYVALNGRSRSPFDRHQEHAVTVGMGPVAIACLLTTLGVQWVATGDASPLPHFPLLNPIDLSLWLIAVAVWSWWRQVEPVMGGALDASRRREALLVLVGVAFICLNGLLARAVHQWNGVALDFDQLWNSVTMQVTLSIVWTLVGLVGMLVSSRYRLRSLWLGCAVLLGVVVIKLFTVDLSQLSTVARIGTFMVVGVLLLVLGYFSPVPPSDEAADESVDDPSEGSAESALPVEGAS